MGTPFLQWQAQIFDKFGNKVGDLDSARIEEVGNFFKQHGEKSFEAQIQIKISYDAEKSVFSVDPGFVLKTV